MRELLEPVKLTIEELTRLSGYPRRTIHFYVQQDLLMPPIGAGLGAYYTTEHVERLNEISRLRGLGWRLDRIREEVNRATPDNQTLDAEVPSQLKESASHYMPALGRGEDGARDPGAAPDPDTEEDEQGDYLAHRLPHGFLLLVPRDLSPAAAEYLAAIRTLSHP